MTPTHVLANSSARLAQAVQRAELQLDFAGLLCELQPAHAAAWRPLIQQARDRFAAGLRAGQFDALPALVESILAPLAPTAKSYTIHCVGHAHIDMNWMWSWPETVAVTVDTFTTVLRLMDEYPEFTFSQSQASTYAILEQYRPDLLRRVATRVKQGRWEVTASHWVEGDKNLASGESLCRHLLYTRSYLRQLFGLRPEDVPIDWAPDTFGHPATMPTYLVRGGVKYTYLHRPGIHTPHKPTAFWWEGPDGSRVLVRNDMRTGYNGQFRADQLAALLIRQFGDFVKLTGGRDQLFVYGVGDHGGGPTRRDIHYIRELNTWPVGPTVRCSTAREFFARLEKSDRLPVIRGELNTEVTGCYTSQSLIKKANRFAENRLLDAERAGVLARLATRQPAPALTAAWRDTLFSQFHDILPGSGVHDTRTYTHGLFQKTMAATSQAEQHAWRRLAALVDTAGAGPAVPAAPPAQITSALGAGAGCHSANGQLSTAEQSAGDGPRPFVVFNPTPRDRQEVVEATLWDSGGAGDPPLQSRTFAVRAPDGTLIAPQVVNAGYSWGHRFLTLAFPAKVAGLGYARYVITEEPPPATPPRVRQTGLVHHCSYLPVERSREGMENDLLRVDVDPTTGGIAALVNKQTGQTIVRGATLEYAVERPHRMTAWTIEQTGPVELPAVTAIRRRLTGPHRASIEVALRIHESTFTLTYELRAGDPKLYLHLTGVWFQRGTPETGVPTLRLAVPLALTDARGRYEIPFGAIDRTLNQGEEVPALQWAQVAGREGGCLLLNDCKHGHSLTGSTLRLNLIRASYDPDILPEIGAHEVHLALQPLTGALPVAEAMHLGQEFNHPLRVIGTDAHPGTWPAAAQLIKVRGAVLSAVKQAESGSDVVVRLLNPTGRNAPAHVEFNSALLGAITGAQEVDLLERPLSAPTVKLVGRAARVTVPAGGITTLRLKIKR